jgi:3'(2'), 5'-bisphosphate nucleotidase
MSDSQLLEAMIGAAIEAGRAACAFHRQDLHVRQKADSSPVTDADRVAEAIILERLAQCAAATAVVAEEQAAAGHVPPAAAEFFLVDPLDGTREFVAGRDEFTVNIALIRRGEPVLGVVYAPALGRLFGGDRARGHAFVCEQSVVEAPRGDPRQDREPIHVRQAPPSGIIAVASRSHCTPETEAYLARYAVAERVSIGSSLKFCLVAQGKADLYPRLGPTMEWDTAAGHAVLAAAGGSVVAADGQALSYGKPQYRNPWFIASGSLPPLPLAF